MEAGSLRKKYPYQYCYCEENIYKLIEVFREEECADRDLADDYVVFISNPNKTVPFYKFDGTRIVWDYHVILIRKHTSRPTQVFDFDAQGLPFPCPFAVYATVTLNPKEQLSKKFLRYFRVLTATEYLATLSSDRSHMLRGGTYAQPPPDWPLIQRPGIATNLFSDFVDMSNKTVGEVIDQQTFLNFFFGITDSL
eukprot:TRINITY_DN1692_c0_g2_i2.p1 TRINITY_DN1692_c0_g2~~TRINITY_DN1692_c0_g2_i2.p1  ORF type:complete len:195 (-),score=19.04 TRINITY_DN1692_c0_g2_i2:77-661(-)